MKNLRSLRESFGLSQQKLAEKVNLTQQKIHAYETGAYEPDINTMIMLSEYFSTSIDFLVGKTNIQRKIEPVAEYKLNEDEAVIIDKYRKLLPNQRKSLTMFIDTLSNE